MQEKTQMPTCNGCLRSSLASILPAHTSSLTANAQRPQNFISRAFLDWEKHRASRLKRDSSEEGMKESRSPSDTGDDLSCPTSNGSQLSKNLGGSATSSSAFP